MLTFLAPMWLWGAGALTLAGAIALWRGRKNRVPVSSTKLWEGISREASGAKKRFADPLWILLWLAAILAGIAAARPGWTAGQSPSDANIQLEARRLRGATGAEIFIRSTGALTPDAMDIGADENRKRIALDPVKIKNGIIENFQPAPHIFVDFFSAEKKIASRDLNLVTKRPIRVETVARVPEPLKRVFAIMNSGDLGDEDPIRVLLVGDSPGGQSEINLDLERRRPNIVVFLGTCVPGQPDAPWKDFSPPEKIEPLGGNPLTRDDAIPLDFGGTVKRIRILKEPDDKIARVVLRAGGHPLAILQRSGGDERLTLQLAVSLTPADTDWPLDYSFPIFFAKLVETVRRPGESGIAAWRVSQPDAQLSAPRLTPFTPWLVIAAIALAAAGSAGLVRRGLRPR
jgi:hypothetical protein